MNQEIKDAALDLIAAVQKKMPIMNIDSKKDMAVYDAMHRLKNLIDPTEKEFRDALDRIDRRLRDEKNTGRWNAR